MTKIKFKHVEGCEDLPIPKYQTPLSCAVDLHAAIKETFVLKPGKFKLIPLGFMTEYPRDIIGEITPRSGFAAKYGISVVNSPGIIEGDYRGEWGVVLINLGEEDFVINRGDRIAQLNFKKIERVEFELVDEFSDSERKGGFGSTGRN